VRSISRDGGLNSCFECVELPNVQLMRALRKWPFQDRRPSGIDDPLYPTVVMKRFPLVKRTPLHHNTGSKKSTSERPPLTVTVRTDSTECQTHGANQNKGGCTYQQRHSRLSFFNIDTTLFLQWCWVCEWALLPHRG
jgi:hypothetical protein